MGYARLKICDFWPNFEWTFMSVLTAPIYPSSPSFIFYLNVSLAWQKNQLLWEKVRELVTLQVVGI